MASMFLFFPSKPEEAFPLPFMFSVDGSAFPSFASCRSWRTARGPGVSDQPPGPQTGAFSRRRHIFPREGLIVINAYHLFLTQGATPVEGRQILSLADRFFDGAPISGHSVSLAARACSLIDVVPPPIRSTELFPSAALTTAAHGSGLTDWHHR